MIAMALALALGAAGSAPVAEEDEIVVLARRLEQVAVVVSRDPQGRMQCGVSPSSGNLKIDSRLCETAARCVRKGAADNAAVKACIDKRKPDLLREFAANLHGKSS